MDSHAQQFAETVSRLYDKIASSRPVYRELENLFRWFALAQILNAQEADQDAGLDMSYLLDRFPLTAVKVDRQLPGRPALKEFEQRQDFSDGHQILRLWLPSCGGVGIEIPADPRLFHQGWSDQLDGIKKELLVARVPGQSTWQYSMAPQGSFSQIERQLYIRRINQNNGHFVTTQVGRKIPFIPIYRTDC